MPRLLALGLMLFLVSCVPTGPDPQVLSETERVSCEASGGFVGWAGFGGYEYCAAPLADGGESCARASDCSGYCDADSRTCSTHATLTGCYSYLDDDGAAVSICVD